MQIYILKSLATNELHVQCVKLEGCRIQHSCCMLVSFNNILIFDFSLWSCYCILYVPIVDNHVTHSQSCKKIVNTRCIQVIFTGTLFWPRPPVIQIWVMIQNRKFKGHPHPPPPTICMLHCSKCLRTVNHAGRFLSNRFLTISVHSEAWRLIVFCIIYCISWFIYHNSYTDKCTTVWSCS